MTSKEIEKELGHLQQSLVNIDKVLDSIIGDFRAEVQPLVEKWIKGYVLRAVEDNPEKVHDLGTDSLKELKGSLVSLFKEMPKLIKSETTDKNDWPHFRKESDDYGSNKNEPFFDKTFRSLISYVAPILDRYGLKKNFKGQLEEWRLEPNGMYRYALVTGFQEMEVASRENFKLKERERNQIVEEIEKYKTELAKARARELFESA